MVGELRPVRANEYNKADGSLDYSLFSYDGRDVDFPCAKSSLEFSPENDNCAAETGSAKDTARTCIKRSGCMSVAEK